jgi:hypothetical protein
MKINFKKSVISAILGMAILVNSAYAGMWELVHSEFHPGTGWLCTYQLQGSSYTATIISQGFCQTFIYK